MSQHILLDDILFFTPENAEQYLPLRDYSYHQFPREFGVPASTGDSLARLQLPVHQQR